MRRQTLGVIVVVLILTLTTSAIAVLPVTSQDTDMIIGKLRQLNEKLEGEKHALQNKVNAVIHQIESQAFNAALNKLGNDVKKSITAWVENPEELLKLIDEIIDLIKGIVPPPPAAPDFELNVQPDQLEVTQGASNTTEITITSMNNFNQEVNLTATTTAPEITLTLNPDSLTPPVNASATAVLEIKAATAAPLGTYEITITGTSNSLTHELTIPLKTIEATSPPPTVGDFEISASPSALITQQGKSNTSIISITSVNGFEKQVNLTATSLKAMGINVTLNPNKLIPPPDAFAISVLVIEAASNASLGTHTITITAESNSLKHNVNITLTIIEPPVQPTPDFNINTFPTSLTIEQAETASLTIIATSLRGFTGTITLTVALETIPGVSLSLNPTQVTLTPNSFAISTLHIEVDKHAETYEREMTITGTNSSLQRSVKLPLKIVPETKPPKIISVLRLPEETPAYNETAKVLASIADYESGVKNATLSYSTNGFQLNLTMDLNAGLYEASIPPHLFNSSIQYRVYASDGAGNQAMSALYSYRVADPYPPEIGTATWMPLEPGADESITVNITVTEPLSASGIDTVTLWYKNTTTEAWNHIPFTYLSASGTNWTATISNQSNTTVEFYVEAIDKAGNSVQSPMQDFNVAAPAFPLAWILAAIAILASATGGGAYYVRRQRKKDATATSVPSTALTK